MADELSRIADEEEEEEEVEDEEEKLVEMKKGLQLIQKYRSTIPDRLKDRLSSSLIAQRPLIYPSSSLISQSDDPNSESIDAEEDDEITEKIEFLKKKISSKRVPSGVKKMAMSCWKPSSVENGEDENGIMWHRDLGQHANGEFSMSVVQANTLMEDRCQVESGSRGTFVGIYDGHGGPEAACFLNQHIFQHLQKFTSEMSGDVIRRAYSATDEAFLSLVQKQWLANPQIASVGSCCLVGIICNGTLYIGNAGDSRVVLGRAHKDGTAAIQLSTEHNANIESVRDELRSLHPDDSRIVVLKHKVWHVKGVIQVSRSIGDAYLKKPEFNREPLLPKYRLDRPFRKPILSSEPSVLVRKLQPQDLFLIFASDGLWEHLSNQEAVNIVRCSPRKGIARKLIKAALQEAAVKREIRYSDLKTIGCGVRRHFHDDVSVIVLFLDSRLIKQNLLP